MFNLLFVFGSLAWAQMYDGCSCDGDESLREAINGKAIDQITQETGPELAPTESSSVLTAPGSFEEKTRPSNVADTDIFWEEAQFIARDDWRCTYASNQLVDGDPKTAWAEGVEGPGIGEVVLVKIDARQPLEIWSGYGKSPELYRKNARPHEVEVVLIRGGRASAVYRFGYSNNPVLGRHRVELQDLYGFQSLPLPEVPAENLQGREPFFVALRILSVYPGEKWEDTCISEIRVVPSKSDSGPSR